jgi:hypothetical protein
MSVTVPNPRNEILRTHDLKNTKKIRMPTQILQITLILEIITMLARLVYRSFVFISMHENVS